MTLKWRPLTMPKGVEFDESTLTQSYGRFSVQPLEKGYGTTLGNSLRRVLLSSLQGAAPLFLRIEGVEHVSETRGGRDELRPGEVLVVHFVGEVVRGGLGVSHGDVEETLDPLQPGTEEPGHRSPQRAGADPKLGCDGRPPPRRSKPPKHVGKCTHRRNRFERFFRAHVLQDSARADVD